MCSQLSQRTISKNLRKTYCAECWRKMGNGELQAPVPRERQATAGRAAGTATPSAVAPVRPAAQITMQPSTNVRQLRSPNPYRPTGTDSLANRNALWTDIDPQDKALRTAIFTEPRGPKRSLAVNARRAFDRYTSARKAGRDCIALINAYDECRKALQEAWPNKEWESLPVSDACERQPYVRD